MEKKISGASGRIEEGGKIYLSGVFIVEEGYMWGSVLEILKEKAAAGVEVRFMYDGMCSISLLPPDYPKKKSVGSGFSVRCSVQSGRTFDDTK